VMTIHAHMPEAEYRAHPAWSWSTAKHALACPAEALDQRERPIDSNDAMRLGTMIHTAILEPAEYALRYIVPPVVERQPGWDVDGKRGAYTVRGVEYATKAEAEAAALPWGWAGCAETYRTQAEAKSALGAAMPGEWVTQELYDDVPPALRKPSPSCPLVCRTRSPCLAASRAARSRAARTAAALAWFWMSRPPAI
jgi:hypothetical protein